MIATISRDELKLKIDRGEQFLLVETLPATAYHHAHFAGCDQFTSRPGDATRSDYSAR